MQVHRSDNENYYFNFQRKLLAIYLHHDRSVLSNVFCVQLLNNENIVKQLSENYVLWGWDVTCESNKNM